MSEYQPANLAGLTGPAGLPPARLVPILPRSDGPQGVVGPLVAQEDDPYSAANFTRAVAAPAPAMTVSKAQQDAAARSMMPPPPPPLNASNRYDSASTLGFSGGSPALMPVQSGPPDHYTSAPALWLSAPAEAPASPPAKGAASGSGDNPVASGVSSGDGSDGNPTATAPEHSFNAEYQALVDKISDSVILKEYQLFRSLSRLARDFQHAATLYARVIISERFVHYNDKTIKPVTEVVGGRAGGEKYIVAGILFKFVTDCHGIYGTEELAAKEAGHELKGHIALSQCPDANLRQPLMMIIDYLGFRVVAMTLLPIDPTTLVYGSSDGGRTVVVDKEAESRMAKVAQSLNLKQHIVNTDACLFGPCDIEIHKSSDGRYYAIDLARLFPPEPPSKRVRMESEKAPHLGRMLRPELVAQATQPLSSDAFSRFIPPSEYISQATAVEAAYTLLLKTCIPACAKKLDEACGSRALASSSPIAAGTSTARTPRSMQRPSPAQSSAAMTPPTPVSRAQSFRGPRGGTVSSCGCIMVMDEIAHVKQYAEMAQRMSRVLHGHGVNMRHLGCVHGLLSCELQRTLALTEMCARTIKAIMNTELRCTMQQVRLAVVEPFRLKATDIINLAVGDSVKSTEFWSMQVLPQLQARFMPPADFLAFHTFPSVDPMSSGSSAAGSPIGATWWLQSAATVKRCVPTAILLARVLALTGFELEASTLSRLIQTGQRFFETEEPLEDIDLMNPQARVKQTPLLYYAEGTSLFIRARAKGKTLGQHLAEAARLRFEQALDMAPSDAATLCTYSFLMGDSLGDRVMEVDLLKLSEQFNPRHTRTLYYLASYYSRRTKGAERLEIAAKFFQRAIASNPKHINSLKDYAKLLEEKGEVAEAEAMFNQALQHDPGHVTTLTWYAHFVQKHYGNHAKMQELLLEAVKANPHDPAGWLNLCEALENHQLPAKTPEFIASCCLSLLKACRDSDLGRTNMRIDQAQPKAVALVLRLLESMQGSLSRESMHELLDYLVTLSERPMSLSRCAALWQPISPQQARTVHLSAVQMLSSYSSADEGEHKFSTAYVLGKYAIFLGSEGEHDAAEAVFEDAMRTAVISEITLAYADFLQRIGKTDKAATIRASASNSMVPPPQIRRQQSSSLGSV